MHLDKYYQATVQRHFGHVLGAAWVWGMTFFALGFVETFSLSPLPQPIRSMYAFDTAANFTLCQYIWLECIGRLGGIAGPSRPSRTVHKEVMLAGIGLIMALMVQHTLVYWRVDNYAPFYYNFFETYPLQKPGPLESNFFFAIVWCLAIVVRLVYGIRLQKKSVLQEQRRNQQGHDSSHPIHNAAHGLNHNQRIRIRVGRHQKSLNVHHISHIKAEGHYCRFHLQTGGKTEEVFAHISIKGVLERLPPNDFIQIHRSHVINTSFAKRLHKKGRSHWILLIDDLARLPVSRYRIKLIKDKLQAGPHSTDDFPQP